MKNYREVKAIVKDLQPGQTIRYHSKDYPSGDPLLIKEVNEWQVVTVRPNGKQVILYHRFGDMNGYRVVA